MSTRSAAAERTAAEALQRSAPDQRAPSRAEVPAEDLAEVHLVAQSTADLASDQVASIDDAVDQITAELAAFCLEQLDRSLTSHDALDLNADASALQDELRVRSRYYWVNQYIQYLIFRSFQRSQSMHKNLRRILQGTLNNLCFHRRDVPLRPRETYFYQRRRRTLSIL